MAPMVTVLNDFRPYYLLQEWPTTFRFAIATPAVRWRVIIERREEVGNDVIMNTVLRIRAAGETNSLKIAEMLQLSDEFIRHLLAMASSENLVLNEQGSEMLAATSQLGWVYRDCVTGELWPLLGNQFERLDINQGRSREFDFYMGSAGRSIKVSSYLFETENLGEIEPSLLELERLKGHLKGYSRSEVISRGEPCIVVSPVSVDDTGLVVQGAKDLSYLSLSQRVNEILAEEEDAMQWARRMRPKH